ncbi:MAG TPA: VCBS repeat-containing protein, partial [Gemmataceae bacterium]|nr:VCBS repeat-containing protein [Gemmataceae bacterium]
MSAKWVRRPSATSSSPRTTRLGVESLEDRTLPAGIVINSTDTRFATGAGPGGSPHVKVLSAVDNQLISSFIAYDPLFTGGVRVAMGDVNGDAVPDIITVPGRGGGPNVKVFSGTDSTLLQSFMAYDPSFRGGLWVAAGDLDGDGIDEVITGASTGGAPHVKAFKVTDGNIVTSLVNEGAVATLRSFFAYDTSFTGGVTVAAADINGDGKAEIVTAPWAGGGPIVKVFSGVDSTLLRSFVAYDPTLRSGLSLAAGDLDGDGKDEIVTGPWVGGGGHVRVFDGSGRQESDFIAFDPSFTGGLSVDVIAVSHELTGPAQIQVAPSSGSPAVTTFA